MGTIFHLAKISLGRAAICAPNNTTAAILNVSHKDFTVRVIGQMKANRSTCYNAGAIFDSISSEPCERKTLVMTEKSQKPLSYFFKWRKQCKKESHKESTTMQVAHEDLTRPENHANDFEKVYMKCRLCEYVWLTWKYPVTIFLCYERGRFENIFFVCCVCNFKIHSKFNR